MSLAVQPRGSCCIVMHDEGLKQTRDRSRMTRDYQSTYHETGQWQESVKTRHTRLCTRVSEWFNFTCDFTKRRKNGKLPFPDCKKLIKIIINLDKYRYVCLSICLGMHSLHRNATVKTFSWPLLLIWDEAYFHKTTIVSINI